MERTGVIPRGAVYAPDLAALLEATGPFVSVYLTTESGIDNAAFKSEQRWKALRRELAGAGAPEEVLAAVDPLVADAHLRGQVLGVIGNPTGVLHVEHGPDLPPRDRGVVGPLPVLVPMLAWRQAYPPFLTVLADRTGADITVHRRGQLEGDEREVEGDEFPVRRSKPGGWSQLRHQHRAENTWEHNADDVAEQVTALFDRYEPRVVVLAGDVRAVELIGKALPDRVSERVEVVGAGRSEDGSGGLFAERVQEQLTAAVQLDIVEALAKFGEEMGQADRAADGPADTLAALARAQVGVMLLAEPPGDERVALFGPEPTQVGRLIDDLRAMGVDDPQEGRLVDAAVRAALATGAAVQLVPDGGPPTGGLGAILRWS